MRFLIGGRLLLPHDHELKKIIDPGWLYRDPLSFWETLYTGPANRGDGINLLLDKSCVNAGTNHGHKDNEV